MASNFQYFYSPSEAAAMLGLSDKQIKQHVYCFDRQPERIPLYGLLPKSCRVYWFLHPKFSDPDYSGAKEGTVKIAAQHLEIDQERDLATLPDQTHEVRVFRAPAYGIGGVDGIPPNSIIVISDDANALFLRYSECWIAQNDIERIREQISPKQIIQSAAEKAPSAKEDDRESIAEVKSRNGDIKKREKSAFVFGRAYQFALNKGALIEPLSAGGLKTAPKQIKVALDSLGLELSETKITELVKSLLND